MIEEELEELDQNDRQETHDDNHAGRRIFFLRLIHGCYECVPRDL